MFWFSIIKLTIIHSVNKFYSWLFLLRYRVRRLRQGGGAKYQSHFLKYRITPPPHPPRARMCFQVLTMTLNCVRLVSPANGTESGPGHFRFPKEWHRWETSGRISSRACWYRGVKKKSRREEGKLMFHSF